MLLELVRMLRNVVDLVVVTPVVCGALLLPPPISCIALCCLTPILIVAVIRFFKRFLPGPLPGLIPV
jgi:hypothetical protein